MTVFQWVLVVAFAPIWLGAIAFGLLLLSIPWLAVYWAVTGKLEN